MNPLQACKTTLSEMKPLLEKHPTNANLKKWCRRFASALAEVKQKGYSREFELFWKAYPRTRGTSKSDAYGAWCKEVDDAEACIMAATLYAKDMKGTDTDKIAHPTTWLNQRRWESYEGVKEKIEKKRMCKICKQNPASCQISYKSKGVWFGGNVCGECRQYDRMEYKDGQWTPSQPPEKKGKDTTTLSSMPGTIPSGAGLVASPYSGKEIPQEQMDLIKGFREK